MTSKIHRCPADPRWFALVNDQIKIAPRQVLPVSLLRELASVPSGHVLIRDYESNEDEALEDSAEVDLSEGNVFFTRKHEACGPVKKCSAPAKMALSMDDRFEIIQVKELSFSGLRALFNIEEDSRIFRDFESPNDEPITAEEGIVFGDGPVFYTKGDVHPKEVSITINNTQHSVPSGRMNVQELKELGAVESGDELVQIVNGEIGALGDSDAVCIVGGEIFVSHPRQGGAS